MIEVHSLQAYSALTKDIPIVTSTIGTWPQNKAKQKTVNKNKDTFK